MTGKYKWRDAKHFFSCDLGEVVAHTRDINDEDDAYRSVHESMTRRIDGSDYTVSTKRNWGIEGESYSEDWERNGEFHRLGKLPARLREQEGPCAEGDDGNNRRVTKIYHVHGQHLKTEKTASKIGEPIAEAEPENDYSPG